MDKIKVGKPLEDFIGLCVAARRSPLLVGRHGVGKSEKIGRAHV